MTTRLAALQDGLPSYDGRCIKHGNIRRWTGSGKCSTCHPTKRGTLVQAMDALYGRYDVPLERAIEDELPCFRALCRHGHNSWRYVKTPHICIQCTIAARAPRRPPPPTPPPKPRPVRYWYSVVDLRSGLIVSNTTNSGPGAQLLRREIKRDHPGMLLVVSARKQSAAAMVELRAAPRLRLDRYPNIPDGPDYTKY